MSLHPTLSDTSLTRTDLRLAVIAQWIRAGLERVRAATMTGRGVVGGAVALWRLAQAVRLAILLARRLKDAQAAPRAGVSTPAPNPVATWSLADTPLDDADLRRAMAELEAAMANAIGPAPQGCARLWDRLWDRERPARLFARASRAARGPSRRPQGRRTPPLGLRPLRPPGPARPGRRRSRLARAPETTSPPIAPLAIGRRPLA